MFILCFPFSFSVSEDKFPCRDAHRHSAPDDEERALNAKFNAIVDTYLPKKDGVLVEKAWNGFSFCLIKVFKGVKNYLNEWFGLELK